MSADLIERLAGDAGLGHGLNLSFFPVLDAAGLALGLPGRSLAGARPYHGFVRGTTADALSPDLVPADPDLTQGLPVRVEFGVPEPGGVRSGPLSLAEDLPYPPFEFTLGIPAGWPESLCRPLARTLLERFLVRYRAYQAYGQHL